MISTEIIVRRNIVTAVTIYMEIFVCRDIEFSAETSAVMVSTISSCWLKNFLQADLLSGNLVPPLFAPLHHGPLNYREAKENLRRTL